jgi:PIN domain nuclease of toxin-antitoxin system
MRVLIDTHTFLWFVSDKERIGSDALEVLEQRDCLAEISIASIWKISIKTSKGKLSIDGGFPAVVMDLARTSIQILPISFEHPFVNNGLPFHHKDPFDRMIASQSIVEGVDLISLDDAFDPYFAGTEVKRIW